MRNFKFLNEITILTIFSAFILIFASCGNQRSEDTKDLAQERNETRFDNDRQQKDAQFLVNASEINLRNIQLGKLAQQRGNSSDAVELGKRMEDTHTKSQRNLTSLAQSKNISIPTSQTQKTQDDYKSLNDKSGKDFDESYANMMVRGHRNAISTYEKAAEDSQDSDIRNWASSNLRELRANLDHSIECQKKFADMYIEDRTDRTDRTNRTQN